MNKILKIAIPAVIVVGVVALGVKAIKNAKARDAAQPTAKIYPVIAKSMVAEYKKTTLTLPSLVEVNNDKDVVLSSRIATRIISIKASGLHVNKGDIVARLDTTELQSNKAALQEELNAANISLQNLQATHKRTTELLSVHGASIEESEREVNAIAQTQAKVVSLQQKIREVDNSLSYALISSPVEGVITKRDANEGALGLPGKPLLSISAKNGFYLLVRVPSDINVKGLMFHNKRYPAVALNSTFHGLNEYKVYIDETNITSGDRLTADVVVFDGNATFVPFDAVLNREGKSYVLIVNKDKAVPKEVHILQSAQQGIALEENLQGERIVIAKPDVMLRLVGGYALKVKE